MVRHVAAHVPVGCHAPAGDDLGPAGDRDVSARSLAALDRVHTQGPGAVSRDRTIAW